MPKLVDTVIESSLTGDVLWKNEQLQEGVGGILLFPCSREKDLPTVLSHCYSVSELGQRLVSLGCPQCPACLGEEMTFVSKTHGFVVTRAPPPSSMTSGTRSNGATDPANTKIDLKNAEKQPSEQDLMEFLVPCLPGSGAILPGDLQRIKVMKMMLSSTRRPVRHQPFQDASIFGSSSNHALDVRIMGKKVAAKQKLAPFVDKVFITKKGSWTCGYCHMDLHHETPMNPKSSFPALDRVIPLGPVVLVRNPMATFELFGVGNGSFSAPVRDQKTSGGGATTTTTTTTNPGLMPLHPECFVRLVNQAVLLPMVKKWEERDFVPKLGLHPNGSERRHFSGLCNSLEEVLSWQGVFCEGRVLFANKTNEEAKTIGDILLAETSERRSSPLPSNGCTAQGWGMIGSGGGGGKVHLQDSLHALLHVFTKDLHEDGIAHKDNLPTSPGANPLSAGSSTPSFPGFSFTTPSDGSTDILRHRSPSDGHDSMTNEANSSLQANYNNSKEIRPSHDWRSNFNRFLRFLEESSQSNFFLDPSQNPFEHLFWSPDNAFSPTLSSSLPPPSSSPFHSLPVTSSLHFRDTPIPDATGTFDRRWNAHLLASSYGARKIIASGCDVLQIYRTHGASATCKIFPSKEDLILGLRFTDHSLPWAAHIPSGFLAQAYGFTLYDLVKACNFSKSKLLSTGYLNQKDILFLSANKHALIDVLGNASALKTVTSDLSFLVDVLKMNWRDMLFLGATSDYLETWLGRGAHFDVNQVYQQLGTTRESYKKNATFLL